MPDYIDRNDRLNIDTDTDREALCRLANSASKLYGERARMYAVGGYPRSRALGLKYTDLDVTSALTPDEIISVCEHNSFNFVPKGVDFGTVEVHVPVQGRDVKIEHTTFRADTYTPGGAHKPKSVRFSKSLEEDARRRDFTVNAIYEDILTGEIIDPTGGMQDLERRIIRATSEDPAVVLRDDGLRIMRMVRFAAELGFDIDEATFRAAHEYVQGLASISAERIRDELSKILLSDIKYGIKGDVSPVLRGLLYLRDLDVFAVILPELEAGRGFEQKRKYHLYDVQTHMLHTAAATPPCLPVRLAGLLHDVGKPEAYRQNDGANMHGHDRIGVPLAREALTRLRYSRETADRAVKLIGIHMYDVAGTAKEHNIRKRFAQWGHESVRDLIDFRMADLAGSGIENADKEDSAQRFREVYRKMLEENAPFSYFDLKITGVDIMHELKLPRGPLVGEIKRELLRHCAVHPEDNNIERLRILAHEVYKSKRQNM